MKKNKIKISVLAGTLLAFSGFINTAWATTANLYVSPSTLIKNTGDNFNISIGVNTGGNKVCVAEGTVAFNNLSCQSITVTDGLMAQSSPTCAKPSFSIGIPSCTVSDTVLFTVNTKAGNAGTAIVSFTGVDIIGEGNSLSSASTNGNYTIKNMVVTPVTAPAVTPKKTIIPTDVKPAPVKNEPKEEEVVLDKVEPPTVVVAGPDVVTQPDSMSQIAAATEAIPEQNNVVWSWMLSGLAGFILGYFTCAMRKKQIKA